MHHLIPLSLSPSWSHFFRGGSRQVDEPQAIQLTDWGSHWLQLRHQSLSFELYSFVPFQHVPGRLELGARVVLGDSMEEVEVELDSEIYTGEREEQKNKTHRYSCYLFFCLFVCICFLYVYFSCRAMEKENCPFCSWHYKLILNSTPALPLEFNLIIADHLTFL